MARKIIGYIVACSDGANQFSDGTLWICGEASLFKTRKKAKRAIEATKKYMVKKGYNWSWLESCHVHKAVNAE